MTHIESNPATSNLSKNILRKREADITLKRASKDLSWTDLYTAWNRWTVINDAVVLAVDLHRSTQMGDLLGQKESLARAYDIAMSTCVLALSDTNPDFVDVQGDGAFAIFWGDRKHKRAICAAVNLRTVNDDIVSAIRDLCPAGLREKLETNGFRMGVADGFLMAKNIRDPKRPEGFYAKEDITGEPVWAGEAVNHAVKLSQQAKPGTLYALPSVYKRIEKTTDLCLSCDCHGRREPLWFDSENDIQKIKGLTGVKAKVLERRWCVNHGVEYRNRILGTDE